MQATQDADQGSSSGAPAPEAKGLSADTSVKLFVHKPGWAQEVGWGHPFKPVTVHTMDFVYETIELEDFHLSHAAALFLLQGASMKTLFADVVVTREGGEPTVFSLALTDVPKLYAPPPRCRRVVLARILERPANLTPDALFEKIFVLEMARSSF